MINDKIDKMLAKILIVATIILLIIMIIYGYSMSYNDHEYIVTVTDKERINNSYGSYYLIFTVKEDGEVLVLKNEDNFLRGKFNSSDFYTQIEVGRIYRFTVIGQRVPFFSWYENIIKIRET